MDSKSYNKIKIPMNYQKIMKNLIIKLASTISLISLGFLNVEPVFTSTFVKGINSADPEYLKLTFYEIGLSKGIDISKTTKFTVFDSTSGVELDISDPNSVTNLVTGVKAIPGTYNYFYAVAGNEFKAKASSEGCYTLNSDNLFINESDGVYDGAYVTDNDNRDDFYEAPGASYDGWLAATSDPDKFGEALLRIQTYASGSDGEPDQTYGYGPFSAPDRVSIGGIEVLKPTIYLTNSAAPYVTVPEGTDVSDLPPSSTRDRTLFIGELLTPVVIKDDSSGIVQLYLDARDGLGFDIDCDAVKFNGLYFDMSVITE